MAAAHGSVTLGVRASCPLDRSGSRFLCAEHRRWVRVPKADAATLAIGDIVSVERRGGEVSRVRVVRTAADELASPER